jgi:peptide/nickel transport system substrate-binding protein
LERRTLYAIIALVIIIAGIGGGSYYIFIIAPGLPHGVPNPNTVIYQTFGEPDYLDPAVDYETVGNDIIQSVYEGLLWYNGSSAVQLVPRLCTSYTVDPSGTTYTFYLRQGVKYHDGTPFTAFTMKYALDRAILINDPDGPAWILAQAIKGGTTFLGSYTGANDAADYTAALTYLTTNGVEAFSNYTLKIHVDYADSGAPGGTPYPAFVYCLAYTVASAVSPSYVWAHGGQAANTAKLDIPGNFSLTVNQTSWAYCPGVALGVHNTNMDGLMCGTGPFTFTEWTPTTRIVLTRNDNYWGANSTINDGTVAGDHYWHSYYPAIQHVIIMHVTEQSSRKLALLAGDCDIADWPTLYANEIYDVPTTSVLDSRLIIPGVFTPTFIVQSMQLSLVKNVTAVDTGGHTVLRAPFSNLNFRLGFQHAFPYDAYIAAACNGHGVRMRNVIPQGMLGYDASVPEYDTNTTAAVQYLNTAMTQMGIVSINIQLSYNQGNDNRKTACLMLQSAISGLTLSTGNVTCTVQEYVWPQFLYLMRHQQLEVFFVGWAPDYADPDDYVIPYCRSTGTYAFRTGYANTTIDNLIDAAAVETNATLRLEMYKEIQMEMYRSAHNLFMYQPTDFIPMRAWVHGWYYNPMFGQNPYWALSKY